MIRNCRRNHRNIGPTMLLYPIRKYFPQSLLSKYIIGAYIKVYIWRILSQLTLRVFY